MLQIGSVLDGKYKILNEIGRGGMSRVYLAINEKANKTWAVKEIRKDGSNDSEIVRQGLLAEAEMLKKLSHPNLPAIIDILDAEDSLILVMDYIEGRNLQAVLNRLGAQDPEQVIGWSKQLCDVLGYLHSRRPPIIYRDMKPANVMLRPDGRVMLIDFGTAREYKAQSTGDTAWLGTRGYAAPEQFGGRGQTDIRTDIYCLGATMYHLLTGRSPADTQFVIRPLGQLRPELAGSGLEKVVAKCCAPEPSGRYQSSAELMYALEHIHDEDDLVRKERSRKWKIFLSGIGLAAAGAAGMGIFSAMTQTAVKNSYDSCLASARNTDDIVLAGEYYRKAAALSPGRPDAYQNMLEDIDMDNVLTDREKLALDSLIGETRSTSRGTETNGEVFCRENEEAYVRFRYRYGKDCFFYSDSARKSAYHSLEEIRDSGVLSDAEKKTVSCLCALTESYVRLSGRDSGPEEEAQGERRAPVSWGEEKDEPGLLGFWEKLEDIAGDPETVDGNTGSPNYSVAMYREVGTQISSRLIGFEESGVSAERMKALIEAAETYMRALEDRHLSRPQALRELISQAQTALADAKGVWNSRYG